MHALSWTRDHLHLPHRHHTTPEAGRRRFWTVRREIVAGTVAAYVIVLFGLVLTARSVWGMSSEVAWGFSIGVTSYILLFTAFISGLVWCAVGDRLDHPSRR
jgi:hypothetical protein